jgi:hypothetical protein
MKVNFMGLITGTAEQIKRRDGARAYTLLEMANNLRLVMRGEETIEAFREVYVGFDADPIDIAAVLPAPGDN